MKRVTATQHREPYVGSGSSFSRYDYAVSSKDFVIERRSSGKDVIVDVFFPRVGLPKQGVGISLPSTEIAMSVGYALLAVAGGGSDKIQGSFPAP